MRRNRFKPGDLVHVKEAPAAQRGAEWIHQSPALVVEVDGPVVRTLHGGVIYAWMFDELEAVREEK